MQTECTYRGLRIVRVENPSTGKLSNGDSFGFDMPYAFRVLDELDCPALPTLQQLFWSPNDARNAIEMCEVMMADLRGSKWTTTKIHEFNQLLMYYRNFDLVYHYLMKVKKVCREAQEMDENPTKQLSDMLHLLHQNMFQREPREAARYGKPMPAAKPAPIDDGF